VSSTAASGRAEQRWFGWILFLALAFAMALFAAVYFSGRERDLANEMARLRERNHRQDIELAGVNQALAIVTGTDTTVTAIGESQPNAKGRVFFSPSRGVLLISGDLKPAPPGKAYQMWILKDGKAKPAGMFQSAPDGSAMHARQGAMADTDAVAVTLENEAGADQPTSPPLFAAPIRLLPR
jgi:hypothetical protein